MVTKVATLLDTDMKERVARILSHLMIYSYRLHIQIIPVVTRIGEGDHRHG